MRRARVWVNFFGGAVFAAAAAGCAETPVERSAEIFGTQITIAVLGLPEEKAAAAIGEVFAHFEGMHNRFHAWRPGELSEVNRAVAANELPLETGAPMAAMLSLSAEYSRRSEGLFNPAAGELFALWGFHGGAPQKPPTPEAVAAVLRDAPNMGEVEMRGRVLHFAPPRARFDFGGIAKGAALDAAKKILRRHGVENGLINAGGNIMALGKNGGRRWRILLALGGAEKIITLKDGETAATSGGAARFFIYGGRRYSHIIHPRTGAPPENIAAASVISGGSENAGAAGDAAATALVLATEEEARRIVANFGLAAAVRADAKGNLQILTGAARLE